MNLKQLFTPEFVLQGIVRLACCDLAASYDTLDFVCQSESLAVAVHTATSLSQMYV